MFNDRKVVCFVTPEVLRRKVSHVQSNGLIAPQSVPPLLPAYNKGVDRHDQIRKTYASQRGTGLDSFSTCFTNTTVPHIKKSKRASSVSLRLC